MAQEPHPDDPYRVRNPSRSRFEDDDLRRAADVDNDLQPDPELAEGPASSGKIALFALGIALVLGAVFYGLNSTSIHQAGTSSTAQNNPPATAQNTAPTSAPTTAPPGMRDVTPRANTGAGTTTGAAPAPTPPSPDSAGATNNAPARK